MEQVKRPNPGSDEARKQGCICPVLDNGYGRGWMGMPGVFCYSETCPVHAAEANETPIAAPETT